eukprot:CAMPEP_0178991838 /NCGR_PEP_ID=MMETSP0795-20121207/5765_1 /TAXON_ID=88552 /ORGANISM="Amoebophrya sp., Strain Ameob2" /LENGTH=81 /DNA_ID=CAMNT_0020683621 /DNA_START=74 /DNA_END=316 /DNA_ORIENTATION=-
MIGWSCSGTKAIRERAGIQYSRDLCNTYRKVQESKTSRWSDEVSLGFGLGSRTSYYHAASSAAGAASDPSPPAASTGSPTA